jgi:hypothetical protein
LKRLNSTGALSAFCLYNNSLRNITAQATLNPGGKSTIKTQQTGSLKMEFAEKNTKYENEE